jgi:hypothetical protein
MVRAELIPSIAELDTKSGFFHEAALWADGGFTTLEASDDVFAAALMCTSAEGLVLADLHLPAKAIVFNMPKTGLVDCEYAILVSGCLGQPSLVLCGGRPARERHMIIYADTLDELLFTDPESVFGPTESEHVNAELEDRSVQSDECYRYGTDKERRVLEMVRHYIVGLLLAYQEKRNWTYEGARLEQIKRRRRLKPTHRLAILGKTVRADMRNAVRNYLKDGSSGKNRLAFQFIVRGHQRNQAHGPDHSLRRLQWIEPYWKGPEDALVLARPVLFSKAKVE